MKRHFVQPLIVTFALSFATCMAQSVPDTIRATIDAGQFSAAQRSMRTLIDGRSLPVTTTLALEFEIERLERIRKDFRRTQADVLKSLSSTWPGITSADIAKYEADGSLEMNMIDGEKRYFANAAPNLFRINKEAKAYRESIAAASEDKLDAFLATHIPAVTSEAERTGARLVSPVALTLSYTLTVKANAVPDGEVVRCWLPYPREDRDRQSTIRLLAMSEKEFVVADKRAMQRTLYAEKKAVKGEPTVFTMEVAYTSYADVRDIAHASPTPSITLGTDSAKTFTSERPPHIVFTPELKRLSESIVGNERDPLKKARLIFTWISDNIPWASAREYSTIPNISAYCIATRHGDCGIKTLLFMTLCRYNGIPAKWQSGWMLHPVEVNLHDWCEIFVDGFGWVPVDQSFGVQASDDARVRYFYLGAIDPYRLIVNDDYGCDLFPTKIFPRSETVDFQRGEVEWRGGNLYFDQWSYDMKVRYAQ